MAKKAKQISKTPQMSKKKVETTKANTEPRPKRTKLQVEEIDHEFEKTLKAKKKISIKKEEEVESDVDHDDEDLEDIEDMEDDSDVDEEEVKVKKIKKEDKGEDKTNKGKKLGKSLEMKDDKKTKKEDPKPSKLISSNDVEFKKNNINFEKRNESCLFVKLLPHDWKEEEIRALHPSIIKVRFSKSNKKLGSRRSAFMEFKSVEVMEQCMQKVKEVLLKKVKEAIVDYCGSKSTFIQMKKNKTQMYTPLKLFVTGFENNVTSYGEIKAMFPKADMIIGLFKGDEKGPKGKKLLEKDSCVVCFKDEKSCQEASSFELTTQSGSTLLIQYSQASKKQVNKCIKRLKRDKKRRQVIKKTVNGTVSNKGVKEVVAKEVGNQKTQNSTPKKQQSNGDKVSKILTPKSEKPSKKQKISPSPVLKTKSPKKTTKVEISVAAKSPSQKSPKLMTPGSAQKRKAPVERNTSSKKLKN